MNEVWLDLVDALPDPSPGRRVDELASWCCAPGLPPTALQVPRVRVEGAAQRADVPQVPPEGHALYESNVLVEARERAVQVCRDLHVFVHHC